jgi:hypothetical protein
MNPNDRVKVQAVSVEDLIDRIAHFDSFRVGEKVYSARLLIPQLVIDATDLLSEASVCAALILYWGLEAARARRAKARAEAAYRQWRDRNFLDIKNGPHKEGDKAPSDTVAEKMYRTLPDYGVWQQKIDDAQEQAEQAEAIYEAFRAKKEMILVEQKALQAESGGPYFVVESPRQTVPRTPLTTAPTTAPQEDHT